MNRIIVAFLLILSISVSSLAQSINKAQKQMDKFNYSRAAEILRRAVEDEKLKPEALPLLAECYRQQRDLVKSRAAYAQVVALPNVEPTAFFYYAQALQATGEYGKAREMYLKFAEKEPNDKRGKLFASHCDSVLTAWQTKKSGYEIQAVENINTSQSDFGPVFYDGGVVFTSDRSSQTGEGKQYGWTGNGYLNILESKPNTGLGYWGEMEAPTEFGERINQEYHDGPATFTADGNTIYITRSFFGKAKREGNAKTNQLKIYSATKANGKWTELKPFFLNSTEFSVGHPSISTDGSRLYFVSDMHGGFGGTDIWMCKAENKGWSQPENLGPVINTAGNEMFPVIQADGSLYFSSEGHAGYGALDIFKSTNQNGIWSTPENLYTPINSSFDDFALAFNQSADGGLFSTNRPGGPGNDDIYAFRKPAKTEPIYITGFVKDKTTQLPVQDATVFLLNPATGLVKVLKTNAEGMYQTRIDKPQTYVVKAMKPDFIADCSPIPLALFKAGITSVSARDLLLDKLIINKTFRIENIYYNFDRYNIRKDAKPELDKLVSIMNENPINVELGSHTDSRGSDSYNLKLSQKRAASVVKYIISAGIDESRITAKGYGETMLTNNCGNGVPCSATEHQANRRTEFKVTALQVVMQDSYQFDAEGFSEGQELFSKFLPIDFFNNCK